MGAIEAFDGMLLFGISTAYIFALMLAYWPMLSAVTDAVRIAYPYGKQDRLPQSPPQINQTGRPKARARNAEASPVARSGEGPALEVAR